VFVDSDFASLSFWERNQTIHKYFIVANFKIPPCFSGEQLRSGLLGVFAGKFSFPFLVAFRISGFCFACFQMVFIRPDDDFGLES
jgi:hypothetical protein